MAHTSTKAREWRVAGLELDRRFGPLQLDVKFDAHTRSPEAIASLAGFLAAAKQEIAEIREEIDRLSRPRYGRGRSA